MLTGDERVKHIIKQADYYGYSGDKVKGLIFCSSIKEMYEVENHAGRGQKRHNRIHYMRE